VDILNEIDKEERFLHRVMFSDEATFHISGQAHRHNVRIWANKRSHDFVKHEHESPKVNVWCALTREHVIGLYFFEESTMTSHNYFDMLQLTAVPQIDDDNVHYANIVTEFLDETFPENWIGRGGWSNGPNTLQT
jgi:hypothetical protein